MTLSSSTFAQGYDPRRTISVTGTAEVKVAPDLVEISMNVETNDLSIDKAREDNDSKVLAVIEMSKKMGIEDKDIQTDYIHVAPRYQDAKYNEPKENPRKFLGYYMTKGIRVTLRDVKKSEHYVEEALKLGINYINDLEFQSSEEKKYRDQIRLDAINAAKKKAVTLARELGQKVGKPITIHDNTSAFATNIIHGSRGSSNSIRFNNASGNSGSEENYGSIAPGQIKIEASVSVIFELE